MTWLGANRRSVSLTVLGIALLVIAVSQFGPEAIIVIESIAVIVMLILGLRATWYFWRLVRMDQAQMGRHASRLLRWVAVLVTVIEVGGLYTGILAILRLWGGLRFDWSPYISGIVVIAVVSIPYVLMRRVESLRKSRRAGLPPSIQAHSIDTDDG